MLWGNRGVETCHEGPDMAIQRIDGRAVERDSYGASPLTLAVSGLFLGWGQCRSGTGAATAAGCREQVMCLGVVRVAHLEAFLVTVTKIE